MKISPIIASTLITVLALCFVALYEVWPLSGCSMGIMKLPFMLGIVPPITGVLTLPAYFVLFLCEKRGINNKLVQTFFALSIQLPLSALIAALVTPIDNGMMWQCIVGA